MNFPVPNRGLTTSPAPSSPLSMNFSLPNRGSTPSSSPSSPLSPSESHPLAPWAPVPLRRAPRLSPQSLREQAFVNQYSREGKNRTKASQLLGTEATVIQPRSTPSNMKANRRGPRGSGEYCMARRPSYHRDLHSITHGRPCACAVPHSPKWPKDWANTPAEAETWDYEALNGGHPPRASKVRFKEGVLEEVVEFEKWYVDEYVKSGSYWCVGKLKKGKRGSASLEDDDADLVVEDLVEALGEDFCGGGLVKDEADVEVQNLLADASDRDSDDEEPFQEDEACWLCEVVDIEEGKTQGSQGLRRDGAKGDALRDDYSWLNLEA